MVGRSADHPISSDCLITGDPAVGIAVGDKRSTSHLCCLCVPDRLQSRNNRTVDKQRSKLTRGQRRAELAEGLPKSMLHFIHGVYECSPLVSDKVYK